MFSRRDFADDFAEAFEKERKERNAMAADRLIRALQQIAHGRVDNGRPLGAHDAQFIARRALTDLGLPFDSKTIQGHYPSAAERMADPTKAKAFFKL